MHSSILLEPRAPSALQVALRRAAHQLVDRPVVLHDPYAVPLLGPEHAEKLRRTPVRRDRPWSMALRAFAVARSCYAEEQLAHAHARGVRQYCLLGAGLDTFAWRNPHAGLRVFEVDHGSMQAWKRSLAEAAGLAPAATQIPADLAGAMLPHTLAAGGLDPGQPAVFALLGVAPYLEASAFARVLALVLAHGPGSGLVLDYRQPRAALHDEEQRQHDSLAARVAAAGEPFQMSWTAAAMARELAGFREREDLDTRAINTRYFANRADGLATRGEAVRLARAWV